MGSKQKKVKLV